VNDVAVREPTEAEAKQAFDHQELIKQIGRKVKRDMLEYIAAIYHFKDQHRFRKLGYGSFDEWLADPKNEIDLSRRQVYYYLGIWRTFVVERGWTPDEMRQTYLTRLATVEPAVRRGKVSKDKAIADTQELSVSALEREYEGFGPDPGSKIEPEKEPDLVRCPKCRGRGSVERAKLNGASA
jgi:hypothetical protein